jgi:hypothetical protein
MASLSKIQINNTSDIVAYLLKPKTVEPEKQLLLANGSETTFDSRQRSRNKQMNDFSY